MVTGDSERLPINLASKTKGINGGLAEDELNEQLSKAYQAPKLWNGIPTLHARMDAHGWLQFGRVPEN
jgi:hypothetical protein